MSADVQPPAAPLPKYSRYRSVRQAATSQTSSNSSPPEPKEEKTQNVALKKSMSRYRRSKATSPGQGTPQGAPPTPAMPQLYPPPNQSPQYKYDSGAHHSSQEHEVQSKTGIDAGTRRRVDGGGSPNEGRDALEGARQYPDLRDRRKRQEETVRQEYAPEFMQAPRHSEAEEAQILLEEQKRKDLERLDAELTAAAAAKPASMGPLSPGILSPSKEKFALFSRKRAVSKTATSKSSGSDTPAKHASIEPSVPIVHGGGGTLPGADAPISAVNAGERRVLVRCMQSSINLPVTPETTPIDLAYSAANILSQGVTPSAAILLESYTQLGLERRIRRYEHVRDIMNSWDRDTQNAIVLQASDSPGYDHDLDVTSVPKERPGDTVVYMYHSQKPGKWNKRYITLLSTGQVFLCKRAGAKITEKDVTSICHLSDFDIYNPTQQQLRKNLRPPKKHCYAIKSQQKTTMFLNTENFVHFFSTDDPKLADKWYSAVQQWRSWYLVHEMGEGFKTSPKKAIITVKPPIAGPRAQAHQVKISVDETPYTIGTFSPLLDISRFDNTSPNTDSDDENRPRQIPFHLRHSFIGPMPQTRKERERHPPPVTYNHRLPPSADDLVDSNFAPTGLLGRTYSQRQRAQKEKEAANQVGITGPFTGGLLDSTATTIDGTGRPRTSAADKGIVDFGPGHTRTASVRRPKTSSANQKYRQENTTGRPLLDLPPGVFEEAPQWKNKRGNAVVPPSGVPLVEVANTPEGTLLDYQKARAGVRRDMETREFAKGSLLERGGGNGGER